MRLFVSFPTPNAYSLGLLLHILLTLCYLCVLVDCDINVHKDCINLVDICKKKKKKRSSIIPKQMMKSSSTGSTSK